MNKHKVINKTEATVSTKQTSITKVIKIDQDTYNTIIELSKPHNYGDTMNTMLKRILLKYIQHNPSKPYYRRK